MSYDYDDGCYDRDLVFEDVTDLVAQGGNAYSLHDFGYRITVEIDEGGRFSQTVGSLEEGDSVTYSGTVSPPYLEYAIDYRMYSDGVESCRVTVTARGVARYLFEP
jgi:hypothetical protein